MLNSIHIEREEDLAREVLPNSLAQAKMLQPAKRTSKKKFSQEKFFPNGRAADVRTLKIKRY